MFDFLKKKVREFVSAVVGKESQKPAEPAAAPEAPKTEPPNPPEPETEKTAAPEIKQEPVVQKIPEPLIVQEEKPVAEEAKPAEAAGEEEDFDEGEIEEIVGETEEGRLKKEEDAAARHIVEERDKQAVAKKVFAEPSKETFVHDEKRRDLKPQVGLFSQIKSAFTGQVEISEKDAEPLFKDFEIALLESDVSLGTAQALVSDLRQRLVGRSIAKGRLAEEVNKEIAFALARVMQGSRHSLFDLVQEAKSAGKTPYVILFLGPNGAGKTTTIAKVAHLLQQRGFSSVISASDTFRAAAIEQAVHHGDKLGVKVVRHGYGADPAAVAFDAIAHAKKHGLDVVLVDTAGRQETNRNLLAEMEKIVRVTKPHLKLFVAEAIAGSALVPQAKAFHERLQLDGLILTKLDCDAKGGGAVSIAFECRLPIFFVGVGQSYGDLKEFNDEWIIRNVLAE